MGVRSVAEAMRELGFSNRGSPANGLKHIRVNHLLPSGPLTRKEMSIEKSNVAKEWELSPAFMCSNYTCTKSRKREKKRERER